MIVGIMQPYFFPYIGYWQLLNAVDTYVIYDDVSFIKNGWINRNRILINGEAKYFNLPTVGTSSFIKINAVCLSSDKKLFDKLLKMLDNSYRKAPYFADVMPLLIKIISYETMNMAELLTFQIRTISDFLKIDTKIILSSKDIEKDCEKRGQEKVLHICNVLGGVEYYNAIGGLSLYDKKYFETNGVKLSFLKSNSIVYKQYKNSFVPNLSIIDHLMFCSVDEIKDQLEDFQLV